MLNDKEQKLADALLEAALTSLQGKTDVPHYDAMIDSYEKLMRASDTRQCRDPLPPNPKPA